MEIDNNTRQYDSMLSSMFDVQLPEARYLFPLEEIMPLDVESWRIEELKGMIEEITKSPYYHEIGQKAFEELSGGKNELIANQLFDNYAKSNFTSTKLLEKIVQLSQNKDVLGKEELAQELHVIALVAVYFSKLGDGRGGKLISDDQLFKILVELGKLGAVVSHSDSNPVDSVLSYLEREQSLGMKDCFDSALSLAKIYLENGELSETDFLKLIVLIKRKRIEYEESFIAVERVEKESILAVSVEQFDIKSLSEEKGVFELSKLIEGMRTSARSNEIDWVVFESLFNNIKEKVYESGLYTNESKNDAVTRQVRLAESALQYHAERKKRKVEFDKKVLQNHPRYQEVGNKILEDLLLIAAGYSWGRLAEAFPTSEYTSDSFLEIIATSTPEDSQTIADILTEIALKVANLNEWNEDGVLEFISDDECTKLLSSLEKRQEELHISVV